MNKLIAFLAAVACLFVMAFAANAQDARIPTVDTPDLTIDETCDDDDGLIYEVDEKPDALARDLDLALKTCTWTGCVNACSPNQCVGYRQNASGGCTYSCILNTEPDRW